VGKKLAQARARIVRAHCRVGKVTRKASVARKRGRVLRQTPRAGRRFRNRAKVNLVVGKGRS
jgi:beta-lactam-binding protein with PASTA domain